MAKAYYVHPTAVIDEPAEIGEGTKIWHFCHVMSGAKIGRNCVLGQNVYVGGKAVIGNGVKIQNNVSVYDAVTLEDDVFCGPSMVFTNVMRPRSAYPRKDEYEATLVRRGATLGANCTILCGTTIGEHAMVGAGSVVPKAIPPHAMVVGVPARTIGWACECGEKLVFKPSEGHESAECVRCKKKYVKDQSQVKRA
jgi:UDP-2-acetamido-3-amino-2,3-dideoxy-glucuronate N-acetyltransferase